MLLSLLRMQAEPAPEPVPVSPVTALVPAPVPAPAPEDVFRASIAASAAGGLSRQGDSAHGETGEGRLSVDWYLRRPVVDDGTPPSLQAYLQRADRLSVDLRGSLFSVRSDDPTACCRLTDYGLGARLAGLFYRRWVVWGGAIEYSRVSERLSGSPGTDNPTADRYQSQFLRPSATVGVRDRAFELRLSYLIVAYGPPPPVELGASHYRNPGWGQCLALATLAVNASAVLTLTAFTLADGAGGSAKYEVFANPRLGIWVAADYQSEQLQWWDGYQFIVIVYMMAHDELGVEWWRSNRFALLGWLSGRMTRQTLQERSPYGSETPYLELVGNLGIVTRVRGHRPAEGATHAE